LILIIVFALEAILMRKNFDFHPPKFLMTFFRQIYVFFTYSMCFSFPPSLTMTHLGLGLCITQFTYGTPLPLANVKGSEWT